MRIFISSVISGLAEFRDATERALRSLGHDVVRAEDFGAMPDKPQATCLAGVRNADAIVLILAGRYGAQQPSGLSATHEEYREARERRPVLVMVQDGVDREPEQQKFIDEVQDWVQGHYTNSFTDADGLRDLVVRSLHELELAHATGPVDTDEMLQRAVALLPREARGSVGNGRVALAISSGPLQAIMRPAQLEALELRERLHQMALFGASAVLDTREGTEISIIEDALVFDQSGQTLAVSENGSITFEAAIPNSIGHLPVIIEEDISDIIRRFLTFANAALAHIDPVNRISHVAVVGTIVNAGHMVWRTREEQEKSPNKMTMSAFGVGLLAPIYLSPPHRIRAALRVKMPDLIEDLTVKLRRGFQNAGRNQ